MATNQRPILPKVDLESPEIADPGDSSESSRHGKKTSTACLACKHARRKCTGQPAPCTACRRVGSECIFDEAADMRRKIATKRTIVELEKYKEFFLAVVQIVRAEDGSHLERFVAAVRDDATLDEIATVISRSMQEIQNTLRLSHTSGNSSMGQPSYGTPDVRQPFAYGSEEMLNTRRG